MVSHADLKEISSPRGYFALNLGHTCDREFDDGFDECEILSRSFTAVCPEQQFNYYAIEGLVGMVGLLLTHEERINESYSNPGQIF